MARTAFAPAALLLLITLAAPIKGQAPSEDLCHIVAITAADLLAAAQAQNQLELPTVEGTVLLDVVRDDEPVRVIYETPGLGEVETQYTPNIWMGTNADGASAVILLRADTINARIETSFGTSIIQSAVEVSSDVSVGSQNLGPAVGGATGASALYRVCRYGHQEPPAGAPTDFDAEVSGGSGAASLGSSGAAPSGGASPMTLSWATKTLTVYVDWDFVSKYGGMTWVDKAKYFVGATNSLVDQASMNFKANTFVYNQFNTESIDTALSLLSGKSYQGNQYKLLMSYNDFDGSTIGLAHTPGSNAVIQYDPDNWHSNAVPDNDFERYYLTAHELGHNLNARHEYAWQQDEGCCHSHRSIMLHSAWYHYHEFYTWPNECRMRVTVGTGSGPC
jgi:hypothetical protein